MQDLERLTKRAVRGLSMKLFRVDPERPEKEAIAVAAETIRAGGLVAFPTETVYGLGCNALDPVAIQRIFAAKGRPSHNPLIVHCADVAGARELASIWSDEAELLASTFWPGPLTLVVPKRTQVPDSVTAGLATVGLRVPNHPVALALLREASVPIAAPSANPSTELSPTRAEHVLKGLTGKVDIVLDAGPTTVGIESTVLLVSEDSPVLLRRGSIGAEELATVLLRPIRLPEELVGDTPRPSPGMIGRHYAPRGTLRLIGGGIGSMRRAVEEAGRSGSRVGVLLRSPAEIASADLVIRLPSDPKAYAVALYSALHDADDRGCDVILVEDVPLEPEWAAVRDRLVRAQHAE
jgi:L-threonylcarbamoyladenylate synthase